LRIRLGGTAAEVLGGLGDGLEGRVHLI
jgi:hypothetical protein